VLRLPVTDMITGRKPRIPRAHPETTKSLASFHLPAILVATPPSSKEGTELHTVTSALIATELVWT